MMDLSILVVILQLLVGGKDAASLVDTGAYWRLRGVDPQAATMLAVLAEPIDAPGRTPQLVQTRRLMAIAHLGKLRDRSALPTLEALGRSPEPRPFENAYVAAAIVAINEEPPIPYTPPPSRLGGLLHILAPDGSGVLHISPVPGSEGPALATPGFNLNVGGVNLTAGGDQTKQTFKIADILEHDGNFRVDAVLLSFTLEDTGVPRGGMLIQGEFDANRLMASLAGGGSGSPAATTLPASGQASAPAVPAIVMRDDVATLTLQDQHLGFAVLAPDLLLAMWDQLGPVDLDRALARRLAGPRLTGEAGGLAANPAVATLLQGVSRDGPIWGASLLPEHPWWGGDWSRFRTVQLETTASAGGCAFVARGTGPEVTTLAQFQQEASARIVKSRADWVEGLGKLPIGMPVTRLLDSVTLDVDGDAMVARGQFGAQLIALLPIAPMLLKPAASDDAPADTPAPEPAPAKAATKGPKATGTTNNPKPAKRR